MTFALVDMTYLGARGNTAAQIKVTLFLKKIITKELNEAFDNIRYSMMSKDNSFTVCMANRLFGEKSYNFLQEYPDSNRYFGTELEPFDFKKCGFLSYVIFTNL